MLENEITVEKINKWLENPVTIKVFDIINSSKTFLHQKYIQMNVQEYHH